MCSCSAATAAPPRIARSVAATLAFAFLAFLLSVVPPGPPAAAQSAALLDAFWNYKTLKAEGRYAEAEIHAREALRLVASEFGSEHAIHAALLNDFLLPHDDQGRSAEAEPLLRRSLAIKEAALGPDHPHVAVSRDILGGLYREQGRPAEAEALDQ